jgi:heme/copper-type cytochrome/quinol oxidase subunit 2
MPEIVSQNTVLLISVVLAAALLGQSLYTWWTLRQAADKPLTAEEVANLHTTSMVLTVVAAVIALFLAYVLWSSWDDGFKF